jgi:hypothetical protein
MLQHSVVQNFKKLQIFISLEINWADGAKTMPQRDILPIHKKLLRAKVFLLWIKKFFLLLIVCTKIKHDNYCILLSKVRIQV